MALSTLFRVVDFRPAEGWRSTWITADGLEITPMPGWLVREEFEYEEPNGEDDARSTGYRDVVATRVEDHAIEAIDSLDRSFWFVYGPGQPDPTEQELADEIARRKATQAARNT